MQSKVSEANKTGRKEKERDTEEGETDGNDCRGRC